MLYVVSFTMILEDPDEIWTTKEYKPCVVVVVGWDYSGIHILFLPTYYLLYATDTNWATITIVFL